MTSEERARHTFLHLEGNEYSLDDVCNQIMQKDSKPPEGHVSVGAGDLSQMAIWKRRLAAAGFQVAQSDVYTTVHADRFREALAFLWANRVEGWWLLQLVKHGITDQAAFDKELPNECD